MKIKIMGILKSCAINADGADLRFEDLELGSEHYEILACWISSKERLTISFEQLQLSLLPEAGPKPKIEKT